MKILQLTVHFAPNVGGVETHLNDLMEELRKKDHQVFVLTYRPISSKVNWKLFENKKNLRIFRIPWFPGLFYKLANKPILEFFYLSLGLFIALPFTLLMFRPRVIHAHGLIFNSQHLQFP
jgi:glycosyltransferase involved in cell wall biosynthesis